MWSLWVLVNPPRLVSLVWRLARVGLSEATVGKMWLAGSVEELLARFDAAAVPVAFGGTLRDDSGFTSRPDLLAILPKVPSRTRPTKQLE